MRSYLFALTDGGGTVPPELGAARRLVERGHRVRVLADDSMVPEVAATGAAFLPWVSGPNRHDRDPASDPLKDWEHRTLLDTARGMADHVLAGPAPGYAEDVLAAVDQERPDLVVASSFAYGAMIGAEARGLPFDVLMPNVYSPPSEGAPPLGVGLRPARGPLGRARDRAVNAMSTKVLDHYTLERFNALRARLGLAPLAHSWDQVHHARRELVLTSADFDLPATRPENVRYVGPVLDDPTWACQTDDDALWRPPTGGGPLVLVALSSTFQDQGATLQRIVDALAGLPVRALVTTGPALSPGALSAPPAIKVVAAAPHGAVMPLADVVVTHGGHGTLVKALAASCPVVVLPHGRDQADNAVRVTERGAGVAVSRRASVTRIARAVRRVLDDPSYARRAEDLGAKIRWSAESSTLVAELEDLGPR